MDRDVRNQVTWVTIRASFCISDSEDGGWVGVEGAESEIKRESQTGRTCEHSENFLLPT